MTTWTMATAFVTGGASGIGRALAREMAARGTRVCIADIDGEAAERTAEACGANATSVRLDVRDADAVRQAVEAFAGHHGRLDYVFNNAGFGIAGECDDIRLEAWRNIIDVNLYGVLHGVLAAYPIMLKQGSGHIVNTASLAGLGAAPLLAPYGLTKHAVVGLSTSLRLEAAARGVRVSVLCPAAIETPLLDSGNPPDAGIGWAPDMRRFLTALAGPPYPVDRCATETLAALDRNQGVIVLPGRARIAWILGRLFPTLVEALGRKAVAQERAQRLTVR